MLSEDVLEFLRSRPIAMLCTRDGDNRPSIHEAFLADIAPDRIIVMVPAHLARHLTANAHDNGAAALLVSRAPGDHRSVQMKGRIDDIDDAAVRPELFESTLPLIDVYRAFLPEEQARELWERMRLQSAHRISFEVAQVFDQTPGPGAGARMSGGAA